jgi:hypothetical protein
MYFSLNWVIDALENLKDVHSFFLNTYLVCKKNKLPVGQEIEFDISTAESEFLSKYFQPSELDTDWYFRVSRLSDKDNFWLTPRYPSTGSQKLRTKEFGEAFIHTHRSQLWGWQEDHLTTLQAKIDTLIPAFYLAIWLFRKKNWPRQISPTKIIETLFEEFFITEEEKRALFNTSIPEQVETRNLFSENPVSWEEIQAALKMPLPEDATAEEGGILTYLELRGVGPARELSVNLKKRLNLFTGDNGLGKTFMLECAWWALSGQWADLPAHPREDAKKREPKISFSIAGNTVESQEMSYNWRAQKWETRQQRVTIPGLLIYAGVDGSFAVWDPAKHYWQPESISDRTKPLPSPLILTKQQVWDGLQREDNRGRLRVETEGLIRDWIKWQNNPQKYPFYILEEVIKRLSPPDLGLLIPGEPKRLGSDVRDIPTLKLPYGEVPILHVAAGVKRIIAIAYLLVWAWEEHKKQSKAIRNEVKKKMVVLIDEAEAHLHPRWQRVIIPALIEAVKILEPELEVQFLIATHSPLVMVSVEPIFDSDRDQLFHLDLVKHNLLESEVAIKELPFIRYGRVDSWLMSEIFELEHARSVEAERVIEAAKRLQLEDSPNKEEIEKIHNELSKYLADNDEFWPRWTFFAERHGVEI